MASTFKNAGITVPVVDDSTANLFTAGASETAVIHAVYVSNKSSNTCQGKHESIIGVGSVEEIFNRLSAAIQSEINA